MVRYRSLDKLPLFDSEERIEGSPLIARRYGTAVVIGDADIQLKYAAGRDEMVKAGPQNQKVLAVVENHPWEVRIRPYKNRPGKVALTDLWQKKLEVVKAKFPVDRGQLGPGGQRLPPIFFMTHELSHVAQFAALDRYVYTRQIPMGRYTNLAEFYVIRGPESEILKFYGEVPRDSHWGGVVIGRR